MVRTILNRSRDYCCGFLVRVLMFLLLLVCTENEAEILERKLPFLSDVVVVVSPLFFILVFVRGMATFKIVNPKNVNAMGTHAIVVIRAFLARKNGTYSIVL